MVIGKVDEVCAIVHGDHLPGDAVVFQRGLGTAIILYLITSPREVIFRHGQGAAHFVFFQHARAIPVISVGPGMMFCVIIGVLETDTQQPGAYHEYPRLFEFEVIRRQRNYDNDELP